METWSLLLGRRTWEKFAALWPHRDDAFSTRMNAIPRLVTSRTLRDVSAWTHSRVPDGDPADIGGLVVVAGASRRRAGSRSAGWSAPAELAPASSEAAGPTVLLTHEPA
jgi:hypothetical protein